MKAIVVQTPGDPEVMHLGEVPDRTRGRGEVLVRTGATPVHQPTPCSAVASTRRHPGPRDLRETQRV
jgi:hypothetical protein